MKKKFKKQIFYSFLYERKYIVWVFLTCFLSALLFFGYCVMHESNQKSILNDMIATYGSYSYNISGIENSDLHFVTNDTNTKSYTISQEQNVTFDDKTFHYIIASKNFFEYANYRIVDGKYPTNENEILAPKWYLFQLGLHPDNMIGSKITLKNPDTNELETKIVSGLVVNYESSITADNNNAFFIFSDNYVKYKNTTNHIYVVANNLKNLDSYVYHLATASNKLDKNVYDYELNEVLLETLGYTQAGRLEHRKNFGIYLCIMALIIAFISIILVNTLTVCLLKWKPSLQVYKIIGANMMNIKLHIIVLFLITIIAGILFGYFLGTIFFYFAVTHIFHVKFELSIIWLFAESICEILILLMLLTYKLNSYESSSSEQILTGYSTDHQGTMHTLFGKKLFGMTKLSFRNFKLYGRKKLINILSISLCILLLLAISIQFKEQTKTTDNNNSYKYLVKFEDYYNVCLKASPDEVDSLRKISNKVRDLCVKNKITQYYCNGTTLDWKLPKSKLGEDYKKDFETTASGITLLHNSQKDIDIDLVLMGYSQPMIAELMQSSDSNHTILENGNGIFLSRKTNLDGNGGQSILSMIGQNYKISTLQMDSSKQDWEDLSINITDETDHLLVYPSDTSNSLCLIIDIDQYNHYFNNDFVSSFYLKDIDPAVMDEMQAILSDNTYVQFINLDDQTTLLQQGKLRRLILMIVILCSCCLFSLMNIQIQNIFEFDYRKQELYLLKLIGISKPKHFILIALESSYTYFIGLFAGLGLSKILKVFLYHMGILKDSQLGWIFVLTSSITILIFMLCSILLTCRKYGKYTNEAVALSN